MATNEQGGQDQQPQEAGATPAEPQAPQDPLSRAAAESAGQTPPPEESLRVGRCSKKQFYPHWLFWAAGSVVLLVVGWQLAGQGEEKRVWQWYVVLVVIIAWALVNLWKMAAAILTRRYRLTTQRLFIERGFLARTTDQTELIRVDDVQVQQSLLQRIFAIGDVKVLSQSDASDETVVMKGLDNPHAWAEDIRQHMKIMRKKSLFVENL